MKAIETQRLSLCVLDKSPKTNGIYREIFASDRMNVEFYTEPEPALSYIRSKEMDLCIGALEIGDRFLLEFIQAAKRPGHNAAVLMIHPRYCAEDVAFFRACGVHVAIPSDTTPLAYRQAILGGINALFGHEVSTNHPSNRERPKSNLSMPDALELAFDDIVDKRGTLVGLPDASESDIAADVNMMSEAAMRIDSENGLISFAESVEKIGKPRAVAALLRLAEKKSNPEQSLWFVQLIALIPSYPTRLALQRLAKTHPSAGPRNLAAKEGKILLQTHPVLFHAERLLAENAAQSRASAIAVALVKSDSNLAFGILTRALVRHCPAIQRACIKGLGHVATGDALEMVCKRLKMFRLARETAFFKDAYEPRQHLLYLESLAAILKATAQSHPEIAEDMAADLASDDLRIRCKAIEIVGLSEKTTCCRRLAGAFAAQDWRVRLAALEAIGGSSDPDCGHELQRFLGDANHIVRQKALQILEQMNMKDGLREVLRTDDHVAKAAAAAALGRMIDDKSIPELIALALNEKHAVAHEALKSLSRIADPDSVRDLQALLDRSDDPELYADATYCIGRVGTEYALDVLMQYARKNCKAPDFRLPLLIRAVGAALDVMAWRVSPQLLEEMTELMERVTRTPGDAAKMEVAGLLLCAKNLDLRAYRRMLTLLDKRLTRHSDSNPYRARMHSVFHQAAAQIRRRIGHIHHINGIMKQIEGALSSLPARPPGGRHRSIITLGKHISSLPQSERTHSAAAKAIEALLALLESSKTPWADRISAMSALSVIGERRALPALQELAAKATSSRTTLVKQAIRAIIRKNIHSPSSQEQEPTTAAEMKPKNVDSTRQAGPYSIHQNQRRALGKQPILAVFPQIQ